MSTALATQLSGSRGAGTRLLGQERPRLPVAACGVEQDKLQHVLEAQPGNVHKRCLRDDVPALESILCRLAIRVQGIGWCRSIRKRVEIRALGKFAPMEGLHVLELGCAMAA